jgi:hypothetical protein
MNMQEVKVVLDSNLVHLDRQGQSVRLELEERIRGNLDLVKINPADKTFKTVRERIGNKMYLIAFLGKLLAQLGSQDSAAAVSRITGYPDPHFFHISASIFSSHENLALWVRHKETILSAGRVPGFPLIWAGLRLNQIYWRLAYCQVF